MNTICFYNSDTFWFALTASATIVLALFSIIATIFAILAYERDTSLQRKTLNALFESNKLEKQKRKNSIKPYLEYKGGITETNYWFVLKLVNSGKNCL